MTTLIKLTNVPHPDIEEGKPQPVYVDASRILSISRARFAYAKEESIERHRKATWAFWEAVEKLQRQTLNQQPNMEDPAAATWMVQLRNGLGLLTGAYENLNRISREPEYYERDTVTMISLACGTGLEHGVMLEKIWVVETPAEVADAINQAGLPTVVPVWP